MVAAARVPVSAMCLLLLLGGCEDPTRVEAASAIPLRMLEADHHAFSEWGGLIIHAWAEDAAQVESRTLLKLEVRTSSGDEETMLLQPFACGAEGEPLTLCRSFWIEMNPWYELGGILRPLGEIPAVVFFRDLSDRGLVYAPAGDLAEVMRRVEAWPEVRRTSRDSFGCVVHFCIGAAWDPIRSRLIGALPVHAAPSRPRDGVVQVSAGDWITVSYQHRPGEVMFTTLKVEAPTTAAVGGEERF
jgi:hypothetical protein